MTEMSCAAYAIEAAPIGLPVFPVKNLQRSCYKLMYRNLINSSKYINVTYI
jgi:hypothetical protein